MERAAACAGVGKATVYRRWSSPVELAAEAFYHAGTVNRPPPESADPPPNLRDRLLAILLAATQCDPSNDTDLMAVMFDTIRRYPEVTEAIMRRFTDPITASIAEAIAAASACGEIGDKTIEQLGNPPIAVEATLALLLRWDVDHAGQITPTDVTRIVDELLLPALKR